MYNKHGKYIKSHSDFEVKILICHLFNYLFAFKHAWQCSGFTHSSVLTDHSWWSSGNTYGTGVGSPSDMPFIFTADSIF